MADVEIPGPTRKRDRLKARAKRYVRVPLSVRTSDLPVRVASALVMLTIAGVAMWLGGVWFDLFIALVALASLFEFGRLVLRAADKVGWRLAGWAFGLLYIAAATATLIVLPVSVVLGVLAALAVDVTGARDLDTTLERGAPAPALPPIDDPLAGADGQAPAEGTAPPAASPETADPLAGAAGE